MTTALTPNDCDLRDFPFMPLDVVRLRDSAISAISTGDEFRCAVLLWCASWHQVPAASLPDDDIVLSQLAGFGRVVEEWKRVREGALRGWVKCDDGRLYHPVVAEKANEAWESRIKYREKKEEDRRRIAEKREVAKRAKEEAKKKTEEEANRDKSINTRDNNNSPALQNEGVATTSKNVAATSTENTATSTKILGDNALIETVDRRQGQWTEDSGYKSSLSTLPSKNDDFSPTSPNEWLTFFKHEHGVEIDAQSGHDRKKFWPLATAWAKSGVTLGQMRTAIAKAQNDAKEPIAFLPGYADRVLANQHRPPKAYAATLGETLEEHNARILAAWVPPELRNQPPTLN